jgi:hypothetical protein
MNPDGAEKEKRKNDSPSGGCITIAPIFVLPLCACITFFYIFPILDVFIHQWQWEHSKPELYTASLMSIGLCPGPMYVGETQTNSNNLDSIDYMFQQAYECEISFPGTIICHVDYDSVYGYPSRVGGYFIEGCWTEVDVFQVHEEDEAKR